MNLIKEKNIRKEISETATQLIPSTRHKSSESNYNLSWETWASWCVKQRIDAF